MPNRTVYLPDDVDRLARDLDVNLSRLTQEAVRAHAERTRADRAARLREMRRRVAAADLHFEPGALRGGRVEAGDDLR